MKIYYNSWHENTFDGNKLNVKDRWCCAQFKEFLDDLEVKIDVLKEEILLTNLSVGDCGYTYPILFRFCPYCGEEILFEEIKR